MTNRSNKAKFYEIGINNDRKRRRNKREKEETGRKKKKVNHTENEALPQFPCSPAATPTVGKKRKISAERKQ